MLDRSLGLCVRYGNSRKGSISVCSEEHAMQDSVQAMPDSACFSGEPMTSFKVIHIVAMLWLWTVDSLLEDAAESLLCCSFQSQRLKLLEAIMPARQPLGSLVDLVCR